MIRLGGIIAILMCMWQAALAQGVVFSASASKTSVSVGEPFQITYSIKNAQPSNFRTSGFRDFDVLSGPNQSSQMTFINGTVSQSISFSYILKPLKEGTFTLPGATANAGGNTIESSSVKITVTKSSNNSSGSAGSGTENDQNNSLASQVNKQVFIRANVDKTNLYQGEQLMVSYKLYFRVNIAQYQIDKMPSFTGFWAENFELPQKQNSVETLDGVQYNVIELKRAALFPEQSGTLQIDPIQMKLVAQVKVKNKRNSLFDDPFFHDPFDDIFNSSYQNVPITVSSPTISIAVKPLPAGAPTSFTGGVGRYSLSAKVDKTETATDDPITYKVTLSGTGNLKSVDKPTVAMPPDFETYDPKIAENIPANINPVSGSKAYEYLLVPRVAGDYILPKLEFTYFDIDKKKYVTLNSEEISIKVKPGKGGANTSGGYSPVGVKKEDLKLLGQDIRFIKTDAELRMAHSSFWGSLLFFSLLFLPILIVVGLIIYLKQQKELMGNVALMKNRRAVRLAQQRLKIAGKMLKQNDSKLFYDEVVRSMWGYVSDKLNISVSDLSKEKVQNSFLQKNVPTELSNQFFKVIDTCEVALYAPSAIIGGMNETYRQAAEIIVALEGHIGA